MVSPVRWPREANEVHDVLRGAIPPATDSQFALAEIARVLRCEAGRTIPPARNLPEARTRMLAAVAEQAAARRSARPGITRGTTLAGAIIAGAGMLVASAAGNTGPVGVIRDSVSDLPAAIVGKSSAPAQVAPDTGTAVESDPVAAADTRSVAAPGPTRADSALAGDVRPEETPEADRATPTPSLDGDPAIGAGELDRPPSETANVLSPVASVKPSIDAGAPVKPSTNVDIRPDASFVRPPTEVGDVIGPSLAPVPADSTGTNLVPPTPTPSPVPTLTPTVTPIPTKTPVATPTVALDNDGFADISPLVGDTDGDTSGADTTGDSELVR